MKPYVILHNAISADGRIDWFTPDIGLFYELAGRWKEAATLAGCDTLLHPPEAVPEEDDSVFEPPAKDPADARPILAVPDSRGRLRNWHYWRKQPYWRSWVALCSKATPKEYFEYLSKRHIDFIVTGEEHVDYRAAFEQLKIRYDAQVIRVDSGGTLNGALLRAGLVSEVSLLLHPCLVGGTSAKSLFRAPDLAAPDGVLQLRLKHFEQLRGDVIWLIYDVVK